MLNISNNNNNNNNNDNDDDNDNDNDNDNDLDYTQISLKRFAFSMATRAFVRATITLIAITLESCHNILTVGYYILQSSASHNSSSTQQAV